MFTNSYTALRRASAFVMALLPLGIPFSQGAEAQSTLPSVTASYATTLTAPTGLGQVYQTVLDTYGDLLVNDYKNGALYEYPVGGGAVVTLVAAGGLGGYTNPGLAIDSSNTLYFGGNYNNCLLRIPYSTATNSWPTLSTITSSHNSASCAAPTVFAQYSVVDVSPYYFQPWALTVDANNNVIVTNQNSGNFFFSLPVVGSGTTATPGPVNSLIITKSAARAQSVAVDKFGNIFFVEETDQKAPLPGVLMIPAGSQNLASDAGLLRVDPALPAVTGVATDAAGNLYISDSKEGVFYVPNTTGTPNTSSAVLLTPLAADGQVSIDTTRNILYVPNNQNGSQVISAVRFNAAALGTTATGALAATSHSVLFGFSAATTPASFVIQEAGTATPDFVIGSTGTCVAGTAYAAQSSCTVSVALSPNAAGSVSAKLLMLDASGNTLASIGLHGTGTGSSVQVLPGSESAVGSGLKTPSQVAVDPGGNVYVADAGLGSVLMYPKGAAATTAGVSVGTGLKAPTGVAADGAGDVFIADSGNLYEVPAGSAGLNAAGQVTLKTGLGAGVQLARTGAGDLYAADPANHRVVKLGSVGGTFSLYSQLETDLTGFNAPSAVAVDQNETLYVADGSNLYQVTSTGTMSTLLTNLSGVTGLAVDPSGSLDVIMGGKAVHIPNVGGTLSLAGETSFATDVTSSSSIALDSTGDLYVTNLTAGNVDMVSADASYNFGTLTTATGSATQSFTILNDGNAPLTVSGFAGTADFSGAGSSCGTAVATGTTCSVTVTFSPGPGDQGTLSGTVLVSGNEANPPVGVIGTGTGITLAASKTTATVTNATVDGAPVVITVAPSAGTGAAPTGQVTLTVTATTLTTPITVTGTLANGTVTLTPPQLPAGMYTYAIAYAGDRTYGRSSTSAQATIAAGAVTLTQPTMAQVQAAAPTYPYVLANGAGAEEPYDSSATQFYYTYPVQVIPTDKVALIGQPIFNSAGKQIATNYGSVTYAGASTATCQPVPVAADGTAPFASSCLSINTTNNAIPNILTSYTITPMYSPAGTGATVGYTNPNYTAFTGSSISFTAVRNPVVSISANPGAVSLTPGTPATATLTLTSVLGYGIAGAGSPLNNYSLPVQLSCDNLPAYATCTFSYPTPDASDPQSVQVGPATGTVLSYMGAAAAACTAAQGCVGPGKVVMTINTNVSTGAVASLRQSRHETEVAAMFGFGLLGFLFRKRRSLRDRALTLGCLLLCGAILGGVSGCSTAQLGTSANVTTTPAGTFTVLVTAKQVGSRAITATPGIVYGNGNQMSLPFSVNVTVQ